MGRFRFTGKGLGLVYIFSVMLIQDQQKVLIQEHVFFWQNHGNPYFLILITPVFLFVTD